jgi:hypothetical protein
MKKIDFTFSPHLKCVDCRMPYSAHTQPQERCPGVPVRGYGIFRPTLPRVSRSIADQMNALVSNIYEAAVPDEMRAAHRTLFMLSAQIRTLETENRQLHDALKKLKR